MTFSGHNWLNIHALLPNTSPGAMLDIHEKLISGFCHAWLAGAVGYDRAADPVPAAAPPQAVGTTTAAGCPHVPIPAAAPAALALQQRVGLGRAVIRLITSSWATARTDGSSSPSRNARFAATVQLDVDDLPIERRADG